MFRYRLATVVTAAVLMSSSIAVAAQDPPAPQTQTAVPAAQAAARTKPEEEMVCTRTRQTGSNRVTRLCRTVEEARIERLAAEESMRRKRSQPERDERL